MTEIQLNELKGQLIDTIEDFLTEKGIASPDEAFIKDEDYDRLGNNLIDTLIKWRLLDKEGNA